MNRVLKRPMFRMGGSTGTGITSGLDVPRKQYEEAGRVTQGLDPFIRDVKSTYARSGAMPKQSPLAAGTLPGFLTQFGLDLVSRTPTGNIFQTTDQTHPCLLYTSPSPRDGLLSRMPSSA